MAEIISRQAAKVAAGTKLTEADTGGVVRCCVITSPATAAWAQNDTIAAGVPIPIGSRFLSASYVNVGAMGTSVTLDVGIRDWTTKAEIDANGIATSVNVASATRSVLNNGALVVTGVESVTTAVSEVYATLTGANPDDNIQMRIEVFYLSPS